MITWSGYLRDTPQSPWERVCESPYFADCYVMLLNIAGATNRAAIWQRMMTDGNLTHFDDLENWPAGVPCWPTPSGSFRCHLRNQKMPTATNKLPQLSEAAFQRLVLQLAHVCGWEYYHTFDSRRSREGFPDLVLWHVKRRLTLYVELKSDRGRVKPEQERTMQSLVRAGNVVYLWKPSDWPAIERLLKGEA